MRDKLLRMMVLAKPMLKSEVLILPPVFSNLPTANMVRRSGAVDVQKKHILVSHIRISFATWTTIFVVVIVVISMYVSYEKGSLIMFFSRCNHGEGGGGSGSSPLRGDSSSKISMIVCLILVMII